MSTSKREINEKIIASRVSKLREYIKTLEDLQKTSLEAFLSTPTIRYATERCLHQAIECVIDIGSHIISALQLRKPEEYWEISEILGENEIVPKEFAEHLVRMIRFRNILVHNYVSLDPSRVYAFLQNRLGDFELFINYIIKSIKSE